MYIILKLYLSIEYYPTAIIFFLHAIPKLIISIIACAAKKTRSQPFKANANSCFVFYGQLALSGGAVDQGGHTEEVGLLAICCPVY